MSSNDFRQIHLLALSDGLPQKWSRPGLVEAYRQGIADGVFHPALHGSTHFCRAAVERNLDGGGERANLLRTLWQAGTPYIHWRMPWIGYEYWDPEKPEDERFLPEETQRKLIGHTVGAFAKLFSTLPRSACAPGYRANDDTHRAWAQHGIRVAQNGPGALVPPHFDRHEILHLYRTVELEPATDPAFSVEACLRQAESCFERGIPAIVSVHSINFHSTVRDFRSTALQVLDEFFTALESKHGDLLYLHDEDLLELVNKGSYTTAARHRAGECDAQGFHQGQSGAAAGSIDGSTEIDRAGDGGLPAGRPCRLHGLRAAHDSVSGFSRGHRVSFFPPRSSPGRRLTIRFRRFLRRAIRWRSVEMCWAWLRTSLALHPF